MKPSRRSDRINRVSENSSQSSNSNDSRSSHQSNGWRTRSAVETYVQKAVSPSPTEVRKRRNGEDEKARVGSTSSQSVPTFASSFSSSVSPGPMNARSSSNATTTADTTGKTVGRRNRVIVIGAGMAGLACARELQYRGYEVIVLEARKRIGGRLKGESLHCSNGDTPAVVANDSKKTDVTGTGSTGSSTSSTSIDSGETTAIGVDKSTDGPTTTISAAKAHVSNDTVSIDMGGALIHGIEGNPIYHMVQQMNVATSRSIHDCLLLDNSGWPIDPKRDDRVATIFNECLEECFKRIHSYNAQDTDSPRTSDGPQRRSMRKRRSRSFALLERLEADATRSSDPANHSSIREPENATSFGDLLQEVCKQRGIDTQSPAVKALWEWYTMNLEVSCGASFHQLGWQWNEDEPYGYDGVHVALPQSWNAVTERLAEPLDVVLDTPVQRIQVIHPSSRVAVRKKESSSPPMSTLESAASSRKRNASTAFSSLEHPEQPRRQSARLRGDEACVRRSNRSNKGIYLDRYVPAESVRSPSNGSGTFSRRKGNSPSEKKRSFVQVTLRNGTVLEADACVCTLPLGLLKRSIGAEEPGCPDKGGVVFDPPLSETKRRAINLLGTGLLNKCAMTFSHVFWQDSDFLGLAASSSFTKTEKALFHQQDRPYLILNGHAFTGKPVLIFLFGGDFARQMQDWTDAEVVADCMAVLRRICGLRSGKLPVGGKQGGSGPQRRLASTDELHAPIDYCVTRWGKEEYSRMAFTYIPIGVNGFDELRTLGEPVCGEEDKKPVLLFAGEHTTPYHPSTIHGAYLSGIREAYRLDLALAPEDNGNLTFSNEEIYQRTFSVRQRNNNVVQENVLKSLLATNLINGSIEQQRQRRRRREIAGVMRLRNRPKPEELNISSLSLSPYVQSVVPVPSRRSVRTIGSQPNTASLLYGLARSKNENSPFIYDMKKKKDVLVIEERTFQKPAGKANGISYAARSLEDRVLLRSALSYGKKYDYIQQVAMPVYDGTIAKRKKSVTQVRERCQKLFQQYQRQQQTEFAKGKKKPKIYLAGADKQRLLEGWVASIVVEPTDHGSAVHSQDAFTGSPMKVTSESAANVRRSNRSAKPRLIPSM